MFSAGIELHSGLSLIVRAEFLDPLSKVADATFDLTSKDFHLSANYDWTNLRKKSRRFLRLIQRCPIKTEPLEIRFGEKRDVMRGKKLSLCSDH
jgi:hypothetical protein